MKIYLAARYERRTELAGYADRLRKLGHVVTSRWLAGNAELPVAAQAEMDLADIDEAEVVVSFTEPPGVYSRGGRHVEFGYALARGKSLVIVGPAENIFHVKAEEQYPNFEALVEEWEKWWSRLRESNPEPPVYGSGALPIELKRPR